MMHKQKLCIINIGLDKGGAETIIANLIPHLSKKYDVYICLLNNSIKYEINPNIKINFLSLKNYGNFINILLIPFLALKYKSFLKKEGITYSLSLLERPSFIACFAKFFGWKGKIVVAENTVISNIYLKNTFQGIIGRFLLNFCYPKANRIIACSQFVKHDLTQDIGLPEKKIITIYNGINIDTLIKKANEKEPQTLDGFWFVHVGSFYEVKNHTLLVTAFSKVCKKYNFKLLLIGKGENKNIINNLIAELDIEDYVTNLGFVENQYSLLKQCKCFILSSNYEGLPTVILEAMALGLPIISTDCRSGPREIIAPKTDFTTQLIFTDDIEVLSFGILSPTKNADKLANAIEYMYVNYDKINNKEKIKESIDKFSMDICGQLYINILESI
jgi:N-acetylgalactosamine-N,N'-diacetylbacillosaminyl-diphospho-undecaprenol 4-alpha-N-acetylgalactosaminyltransferase